MPVCPACKVRHSPYSCSQYQQLRAAENAADDAREGDHREAAAEHEEQAQTRRRRRRMRRRARSI
jgi:hypothetical protein